MAVPYTVEEKLNCSIIARQGSELISNFSPRVSDDINCILPFCCKRNKYVKLCILAFRHYERNSPVDKKSRVPE